MRPIDYKKAVENFEKLLKEFKDSLKGKSATTKTTTETQEEKEKRLAKLKEDAGKIKIKVSDFDEEQKLIEDAKKIKIKITVSEPLAEDIEIKRRDEFTDLNDMIVQYLENDFNVVPANRKEDEHQFHQPHQTPASWKQRKDVYKFC